MGGGGDSFVEAEGFVHFLNAGLSEYTLCGDAWDLGSDEPGYEWKATESRTVTCATCAAIIKSCQGIRTRVRR